MIFESYLLYSQLLCKVVAQALTFAGDFSWFFVKTMAERSGKP
jgi:hypothetical protein